MSGWENVPKDAPRQPAAAPRSRKQATTSGAVAQTDEFANVEDGEWIRKIEWYFPHIWLVMLSILCVIGIYSAVGKLPHAPW